jgi:hypothetical protein
MKRIIMMLTVAAMMVTALTVTSAGAFAASPSQQACEDGGGEFDRQQGQAICVQPEVVEDGKSQNPKFQKTSQDTDTGQGNLNNKEDTTTTETCSKPCPPGQFN